MPNIYNNDWRFHPDILSHIFQYTPLKEAKNLRNSLGITNWRDEDDNLQGPNLGPIRRRAALLIKDSLDKHYEKTRQRILDDLELENCPEKDPNTGKKVADMTLSELRKIRLENHGCVFPTDYFHDPDAPATSTEFYNAISGDLIDWPFLYKAAKKNHFDDHQLDRIAKIVVHDGLYRGNIDDLKRSLKVGITLDMLVTKLMKALKFKMQHNVTDILGLHRVVRFVVQCAATLQVSYPHKKLLSMLRKGLITLENEKMELEKEIKKWEKMSKYDAPKKPIKQRKALIEDIRTAIVVIKRSIQILEGNAT